MKKINGHNAGLDTPKATGAPGKLPDKASAPSAGKRPFPPFHPKDAKSPPLRAARGDDDIMSEEPSVPEGG